MFTSISAGVGDLPCFPTFFYISILKFLFFPYTCNISVVYTCVAVTALLEYLSIPCLVFYSKTAAYCGVF